MVQTKQIPTMKEYDSFNKSVSRPEASTGVSGELARPSLTSITKGSNAPSPKMGKGVDPHSVVENDLAEYRIWKNGGYFNL